MIDEEADVHERENNQLCNRNPDYLIFSDNLIDNVKAKKTYDNIENQIKVLYDFYKFSILFYYWKN